jgi:large subunit ribosomal protein L4e
MKMVNVFNLEGKSVGEIEVPKVFETAFRPDVIRRAVIAIQSHRLQPKGRDIMAGKRTSAESYGVGRGLARLPRVKGERHPKSGAAAFAPRTVGGRLAHPPVSGKTLRKKINKKELKMALRSAIAATSAKEIVASRGHRVDKIPCFPLVVSDEIQKLDTTAKVKNAFLNLGIWDDVERTLASRKALTGKSRRRGRGRKHAVGPLIVIKEDNGIGKAARNIVGVNVVKVKDLNVELLAPGTHPGRLTVWSESAVKALEQLPLTGG